jgi:hypothetical protein
MCCSSLTKKGKLCFSISPMTDPESCCLTSYLIRQKVGSWLRRWCGSINLQWLSTRWKLRLKACQIDVSKIWEILRPETPIPPPSEWHTIWYPFLVIDSLCLSSSSALHFWLFFFLVHYRVNQDDQHVQWNNLRSFLLLNLGHSEFQ